MSDSKELLHLLESIFAFDADQFIATALPRVVPALRDPGGVFRQVLAPQELASGRLDQSLVLAARSEHKMPDLPPDGYLIPGNHSRYRDRISEQQTSGRLQ